MGGEDEDDNFDDEFDEDSEVDDAVNPSPSKSGTQKEDDVSSQNDDDFDEDSEVDDAVNPSPPKSGTQKEDDDEYDEDEDFEESPANSPKHAEESLGPKPSFEAESYDEKFDDEADEDFEDDFEGDDDSEDDAPKDNEQEKCPQCGAKVEGTQFCRQCGYKLKDSPRRDSEADADLAKKAAEDKAKKEKQERQAQRKHEEEAATKIQATFRGNRGRGLSREQKRRYRAKEEEEKEAQKKNEEEARLAAETEEEVARKAAERKTKDEEDLEVQRQGKEDEEREAQRKNEEEARLAAEAEEEAAKKVAEVKAKEEEEKEAQQRHEEEVKRDAGDNETQKTDELDVREKREDEALSGEVPKAPQKETPEANKVIVTFEPGKPLGMNVVHGKVTKIIEGGQGEREGIKKGWRLIACMDQPCDNFHEKCFEDCKAGNIPFQATFDNSGEVDETEKEMKALSGEVPKAPQKETPEANKVIVTFESGKPLGMIVAHGKVTKVNKGGQGEREGIKKGWRLIACMDQPCDNFHEKCFEDCKAGNTPFQATFDNSGEVDETEKEMKALGGELKKKFLEATSDEQMENSKTILRQSIQADRELHQEHVFFTADQRVSLKHRAKSVLLAADETSVLNALGKVTDLKERSSLGSRFAVEPPAALSFNEEAEVEVQEPQPDETGSSQQRRSVNEGEEGEADDVDDDDPVQEEQSTDVLTMLRRSSSMPTLGGSLAVARRRIPSHLRAPKPKAPKRLPPPAQIQSWDTRHQLCGTENELLPKRLRAYFSRPQSLPELKEDLSGRKHMTSARRRLSEVEIPHTKPTPITADSGSPVIPHKHTFGGHMKDRDHVPRPWNNRWSEGIGTLNDGMHPSHRQYFSKDSLFAEAPSQRWRRYQDVEVTRDYSQGADRWKPNIDKDGRPPRFPPIGF